MKTSREHQKLAALSVSILLALAIAEAEDRRTDTSALTVMTFNGEFLWDGVPPEEGQVNFAWKNSQTEAEEHMAKVAQVIIQANPDIINMVEVENLDALKTLNDTFLAGRGYKAYLIDGRDTYTGQDVGLLTRIDPENDAITRDDRKGQSSGVAKSVSKNYVAKIDMDGKKLALIGIHFLAQPNNAARKPDREAQAETVRAMAIELKSQNYLPVVLGDFNDYDDASDCMDHIDSTPISTVLHRIREMDPATPDDDLKNVTALVPKANRYTAFWDKNDNGQINAPGEFTSIDHILLSPALFALVESVDMPHTHDPRFVSDHFPVVVRLKLNQTTPPATAGPRVRIESLLPNPIGDDSQNEEATIKNTGTAAVSMTAWVLANSTGRTWSLNSLGTINPGQQKTVKRSGQAMALRNSGDTIDLKDPQGHVVQSVTYGNVDEGELVTPANN